MVRVSVVIPFHNRIPWVAEALQSVFDQTYTDYEVILVNNGSTDDLAALEPMLEDTRVRYVPQENRGSSGARNRGISLARGDYIAFLDSDDLWLPSKLEKQITYMEQHPNILMSHTSFYWIDRDGEFIGEVPADMLHRGSVYHNIYVGSRIATPTVMIRRDALDETIRFEEGLHEGADLLFWIQLAKKSEVLGIGEPLARVRIHGDNAASTPSAVIRGMNNLIDYGIKREKDLSVATRRRLLSTAYLNMAYAYFQLRDLAGCGRFIFAAVSTWPPNGEIYRFFAPHRVVRLLLRESGLTARGRF